MSTRESYEAGTPCWVDLMTPDVDAATTFYTSLFGWTAEDSHDESGTRIYTNFLLEGQLVAGMGAQPDDMTGMPPFWSSYVATDDVDATTATVEQAGGTVMMPPMDVMDQGRMAIYGDPAGAAISVWQAGAHHGAAVCNEPGTWAWNELMSRDIEASTAFYTAVFGWEYDGMEMPFGTYHVIRGGDEGGLGGLMAMPPDVPAEVPSYWTVYFLVEDADAAIDRARELGGRLVHGPDDMPVGRLATIEDPQGGVFMVMQPASQE
ncbi:VOC family protein [Serinicoccus kebangsaanensis]|uniref:VOC family protein n=1 Tax=Serinicoccus kebangsaanensis TaxID=2602069 RepID=UPI00124DBA13|nr:VOC family protein [Serinicoccus kebangsaanensis]